MQVRDEDTLQLTQAQRRTQHLVLRSLPAIEEPEFALLHQLQTDSADVAIPTWRAGTRAKKSDLQSLVLSG